MKKALLFIAAAVASGSAFAGPGLEAGLEATRTAAYAVGDAYTLTPKLDAEGKPVLDGEGKPVNDQALNDLGKLIKLNIKKNYTAKKAKQMVEKGKGETVTGLTGFVFDPSTAFDPEGAPTPLAWETASNTTDQYKFSWDGTEKAIKVDFKNLSLDGANTNYKDFNFRWTRQSGNNLFETDPTKQDSIFGQFVDMTEHPKVYVTVKAVQKMNLRCDLVDANGRVSNGSSPDIIGITPGGDVELEFRFKSYGADLAGKTATTTLVEDWYNGDLFGTPAARDNRGTTAAPSYMPPFYGLQGNACIGMAPLDMSKIAKVSFTIDNGTGGVKDDVKVLYIKNVTIGNKAGAQTYGDPLNKALIVEPTTGLKGIAKKSIKAYAVANAIKVEGKAKVYNMMGQVVAEGAESIEVPCKGLYRVVNAKGAKTVVVK